jgi:hypothetical protein
MSFLSKMNAYLMGSSRFNSDLQQRHRAASLLDFVVSYGLSFPSSPCRDFLPVLGIPAERQVDGSGRWRGNTVYQGEVLLFNLPVLELFRQVAMRSVVFCNEHDAASELIEAMDDPRPPGVSAFQRTHPVEQCIHKRPGSDSCPGVAYKSCRFIDYGQIGILIQDVQRNIFRKRLIGFRWRKIQCDPVVEFDQVSGFYFCTVDLDVAFANPILDLRTALSRDPEDQKLV